MNYAQYYSFGKKTLIASHVPDAPLEARLLLEYVCKTTHHDLLAHGDRILSSEEEAHYRTLLQKRANRIPLSHLTGTAEFMGLPFMVNASVLIPRADTEILVEETIPLLTPGTHFLDLCTGSGCIALSLLHFCKGTSAVATDLSPDALQIAQKNAERLGLQSRISFLCCDLFPSHRKEMFPLIVSNPPYIRTEVIPTLEAEVRDHEPVQALDGGGDGLLFYRRILALIPHLLQKGGHLLLEIGYDQNTAVVDLMRQAGLVSVKSIKDLAGRDRVVCGTLPLPSL